MHNVHNKHVIEVETKMAQFSRKSILQPCPVSASLEPGLTDVTTYNGRHQRLIFQKKLHCFAVDDIIFLVNELSYYINLALPGIIVNPGQCSPLLHIQWLAHILHTGKRYEASGTRTLSFVTNAGEKHPKLI